MTRRKNPPITPQLRLEMARVVSDGVFAYINEFAAGLYPDPTATEALDCTLDGVADAMRRYELAVQKPLLQSLAFNLLDNKEPAT